MEPHLSPNLIGAYNDGNEKVRGVVCTKLLPKIIDAIHDRMGEWYDAKDLTSDVILRLLKHKKKFETIRKLENWVETTTGNACKDEIRKMKNRQANAYKVSARLVEFHNRSMENIRNIRICQRLHDLAFQHLPPKSREVYYLSYIEGLSVKQVAEKMVIDESTVKNHRNYALNKLRLVYPDEPVNMGMKVFFWFSIPFLILYMLLQKLWS